MRYIDADQLKILAAAFNGNDYGKYLEQLAEETINPPHNLCG
jgi:hypothetical protein